MKKKGEEKKVNNSEEENKLKEVWVDPKGQAAIKLGLWLIFIIAIVIYARISLSQSNSAKDTTPKEEVNKVEKSLSSSKSKISFNGIEKGNYSFINEVNIIKNNTNIKYFYNGKRIEDKMLLIKIFNENPVQYKIDDNLFYKSENDVYSLTTEEEIFDVVKENYIDMDSIIKLIDKGEEDYTTTYNDGRILISYKVYLKNIVENNTSEDYMTIVTSRDDNTYIFEIDYTNLVKLTDTGVTKYTVKAIINDIGKIEDEDIK